MKWRMSFATYMLLNLVALRSNFNKIIIAHSPGIAEFPVPAGGSLYFLNCPVEFDNKMARGAMELVPDVATNLPKAKPEAESTPAVKEDA